MFKQDWPMYASRSGAGSAESLVATPAHAASALEPRGVSRILEVAESSALVESTHACER